MSDCRSRREILGGVVGGAFMAPLMPHLLAADDALRDGPQGGQACKVATLRGTPEQLNQYLRAVASMWVVWLMQTREDIRAELRHGELSDTWDDIGLTSVLTWEEILEMASRMHGFRADDPDHLFRAAAATGEFAEMFWGAGDPCCPPNGIVRMAVHSSLEFIRAAWEMTEG